MSRILDRNKYSHKTIENFEIVSAYYIDIFYNHLYIEAKKLKTNGKVSSITEGYKHTLNAFLKGLDNPKIYKKSILGIHNYYISIGFASISFTKCIDKLTKEFIPSDYFGSLTVTQKMGVLRMVINQSIKVFIRKIVNEHMVKIIDYHKEADNVRILQDEFIDCLILEREGMYQRFIVENTKTNKCETVNNLLVEKMQNEIKRLIKEKYEQHKKIAMLKKLIIKKNTEIENLKELSINTNNHTIEQKQEMNVSPKKKSNNETSNIDTYNKNVNLIENNIKKDSNIYENQLNMDISDESDDQQDTKIENNSSFIEINDTNIDNIINGESNEFCITHIDSGTMLEDFT